MWFAALPVTFITPLSDFTIPEGDSVTFKCVTSKPEKVQWFKNGKKITKPDKRIQLKDDGAQHTLTIDKSVLDDGAEYSAKIGDQSTVGKLIVEGKYCMFWIMRHIWYMCFELHRSAKHSDACNMSRNSTCENSYHSLSMYHVLCTTVRISWACCIYL